METNFGNAMKDHDNALGMMTAVVRKLDAMSSGAKMACQTELSDRLDKLAGLLVDSVDKAREAEQLMFNEHYQLLNQASDNMVNGMLAALEVAREEHG